MFTTLLSTFITFVITITLCYIFSIHLMEFVKIYELGLEESERLKREELIKTIKEEIK